MKIKTTVQLIEYSNLVLLAGLFIAAISILSKTQGGGGFLFTLELTIGGACVIIFLFRTILVGLSIKTSRYPDLLYSVLDKLGFTRSIDIALSDSMMDEIYKPEYPTQEFLQENNLETEISLSKPAKLASMPLPRLKLFDLLHQLHRSHH
jgi:hypothetical protein